MREGVTVIAGRRASFIGVAAVAGVMAALGVAWDLQRVPKRIYDEATATRAKRPAHQVPSILDVVPMPPLELAED